ncbi:unnamed protein product [Brassica oleracea]
MCCDRISELPDSLLTHILSYLPTKDSVKTSVLSKRWELLWLNVSGLDLNTMDFLPYGEALLGFMDRFLEFNCGSCLQTFKMKYCRYTEIGYDSITPRGLDIMPDCIYVSKTLVSLKLVQVGLEDPKFAVSLPCLKIMHGDFLCYCWNSYKEYVTNDGRFVMENLISGSHGESDLWLSYWTNVPQCLSSTLEYVKIGVSIMEYEAGIKLVNYFLENSAVLKKLTLSCKHSLTDKREAQSYKKLLTSTKLSPRCQVSRVLTCSF